MYGKIGYSLYNPCKTQLPDPFPFSFPFDSPLDPYLKSIMRSVYYITMYNPPKRIPQTLNPERWVLQQAVNADLCGHAKTELTFASPAVQGFHRVI